MRAKIFAVLVIAAFAGMAAAVSISDGAGTTAFAFLLENDIGVKSSALGGAWVGWGKSADAFASNPAAAVMWVKRSAEVSFGNFWELYNSGFGGYSHRIDQNTALAGGVNFVSYGSFTRTDESGNVTGEFSGSDFEVVGAFARKFSKSLSAGISAKFLYSGVDTFTQTAVGFDLGVMYRGRRDHFRAGLVLANLGTVLSAYSETKASLPLTVKLGGYYYLPGFPGELGVQVETGKDVDLRVRAGLELDFLKPVYFRVGYVLRPNPDEDPAGTNSLNGLTAGLGLELKKFSFGYSLQHYGALGFVHRAGIGYSF